MTSTSDTFSSPAEEIAHLKDQIQQLTETFEAKIRLMQHQMDGLLKRLYGKSIEKIDPVSHIFIAIKFSINFQDYEELPLRN